MLLFVVNLENTPLTLPSARTSMQAATRARPLPNCIDCSNTLTHTHAHTHEFSAWKSKFVQIRQGGVLKMTPCLSSGRASTPPPPPFLTGHYIYMFPARKVSNGMYEYSTGGDDACWRPATERNWTVRPSLLSFQQQPPARTTDFRENQSRLREGGVF